jgi:hypothetical protein
LLGKFSPTDVEGSSHRRDEHETDEPDRLLLYPPRVLGYANQQKIWGQFKVDSVKAVSNERSSAAFEKKLALKDDHKLMIKALVENHESSKSADMAPVSDVIEGKGRGLVILLHGSICCPLLASDRR